MTEGRAHWDAVLADIEQRIDQVRQIKPEPTSAFMIGSMVLGAALFAAGMWAGALLLMPTK